MKRNSPSLQFLFASATTDATMSSRPSFRGSRSQWRRGYSDRPSDDCEDQYVTGDSHFRSVRNANRGYRVRQVERGTFSNAGSYRPQPQLRPPINPPPPFFNASPSPPPFNQNAPSYGPPSPPFNQNQPFHPPPLLQQQHQFRPQLRPPINPHPCLFNPPPPIFNSSPPFAASPRPPPNAPSYRPLSPTFNQKQPFHRSPLLQQQQQFCPRPPKPSDYRVWEFARTGPPPDCERFTVLSYNILADYLAISHRSKLYFHIPRHILDWEWRKRNIIFELGLWSADVLCFQEVDRFEDLEAQLKLWGYNGIWKMRTGNPIDGCAIFWRASRFKFLYEECIEFNKLGLRDNVAQICVLELIKQPNNQHISAVPTSSEGSNKVVICNIHVLYNPRRGEIKLGQVRVLLDRAHAVSKLWDDAPVVICGDFNCTPKSPLYNFILEQKLDLSKLSRDKVSGQASAEIHPPRPFNPNFGSQQAYSSVRPPAIVDEKELRQSGSPLDGQDQDDPDDNSRSVPSGSSIPQFHDTNIEVNVLTSSCITMTQETKNFAFSDEPSATHVDMVYVSNYESACNVSVSGSNEWPITALHEGGCPDDEVKNEICETSLVEFYQKDNSSISKDEVALNVLVSGSEDCSISAYDGVHPADELKDEICFTTTMESHCENNSTNEIQCGDCACSTSATKLSETNSYTKNVNCNQGELFSAADRFSIDSVTGYESVPGSENLFAPAASDRNCPETFDDVNASCEPESIDFSLDKKIENLRLNETVEATQEDGSLVEDCNTFLSELHNNGGSFPSELRRFQGSVFDGPINSSNDFTTVSHSNQFHSVSNELPEDSLSVDFEAVDVERSTYDPSAWTTMEFETATGTADCTFMEHPLKLTSTYAEVEVISGTRDTNGEPLVTSYNRCFSGTVDYIWRSEGLQTVKVLAPIPKRAMQWTHGFPTKKWGSDHIALVSELAFTKDMATQCSNSCLGFSHFEVAIAN